MFYIIIGWNYRARPTATNANHVIPSIVLISNTAHHNIGHSIQQWHICVKISDILLKNVSKYFYFFFFRRTTFFKISSLFSPHLIFNHIHTFNISFPRIRSLFFRSPPFVELLHKSFIGICFATLLSSPVFKPLNTFQVFF